MRSWWTPSRERLGIELVNRYHAVKRAGML